MPGDVNLAIQDYNQAIKLNPKFAQAYNNRGVAYDHKGDFDRALQDFDQAIKLKPSALTHFNRGNAYLGKIQYDHAIDDYNQAIKLKPDFAAAYDNAAGRARWSASSSWRSPTATRRCSCRRNKLVTLESRGFVFLKMTNFDAAVSDYEAALRHDPTHASALYGRGVAKLKNEDTTGEADITAAKAIQSDIAEEYARYGVQDDALTSSAACASALFGPVFQRPARQLFRIKLWHLIGRRAISAGHEPGGRSAGIAAAAQA